MPISFTVNRERPLVTAVATHRITIDDALLFGRMLRSMQLVGYPTLIEDRDAELRLSGIEASLIAENLRSAAGGATLGPIAVVVSAEHTHKLIHMLEIHVADVCELRLFLDRALALAWLEQEQ